MLVPALGIPDVSSVGGVVWWILMAVKLVAFVDAARRSRRAFLSAEKMTKPGWLVLLGTFILAQVVLGLSPFISLLGLVAAIVYFVDARPALTEAAGGRSWLRRRRGPRAL